jgi:hypothetical protein
LVWWATDRHSPLAGPAAHLPSAVAWIRHVHQGLQDTSARYPFLSYGTDWLAFVGPLRDPVRNIWVLDFGLIACAGVIPRLPIDMSFGVLGAIPLLIARCHIRSVEHGAATRSPLRAA